MKYRPHPDRALVIWGGQRLAPGQSVKGEKAEMGLAVKAGLFEPAGPVGKQPPARRPLPPPPAPVLAGPPEPALEVEPEPVEAVEAPPDANEASSEMSAEEAESLREALRARTHSLTTSHVGGGSP